MKIRVERDICLFLERKKIKHYVHQQLRFVELVFKKKKSTNANSGSGRWMIFFLVKNTHIHVTTNKFKMKVLQFDLLGIAELSTNSVDVDLAISTVTVKKSLFNIAEHSTNVLIFITVPFMLTE